MSENNQSETDRVADLTNKSEAVVVGEEKGDDIQDSHRPKRWQSNVTIFSCVRLISKATF